jgi:hypothetical protein
MAADRRFALISPPPSRPSSNRNLLDGENLADALERMARPHPGSVRATAHSWFVAVDDLGAKLVAAARLARRDVWRQTVITIFPCARPSLR